jgi:hypothetical protein
MVSENAHGCAQNVENCFGFGFYFLERYHKDGDEFLSHILTGDETWVSFVNVETKEHSKHWMHTHSSKKPKHCKHALCARKLVAAVFWDRKGGLMVKVTQQETTITSQVYCRTLKELRRASLSEKWRGMLTYGVVFLHDNARRHTRTVARTRALLEHINRE